MNITIHRGANQIGGCITEISTEGCKIFIDFGSNLPDHRKRELTAEQVNAITSSADAIYYTHYHGDHVGLHHLIPPNVKQYIGEGAKEIMLCKYNTLNVHGDYCKQLEATSKMQTYQVATRIDVANKKKIWVTPYFVSHSAFDAYMFLVECEGKRILHTGDFRKHGYLGKGLYPVICNRIGTVDILITEGTMLGRRNEQVVHEYEIKKNVTTFLRNHKYVYALCSSTDLDRLASFHAACNRTGRIFFVDEYQKNILDIFTKYAGRRSDLFKFNAFKLINYKAPQVRQKLSSKGFLMPIRMSSENLVRNMMTVYNDDESWLIYATWSGYAEEGKEHAIDQAINIRRLFGSRILDGTKDGVHTSGHADIGTLQEVCQTVKPRLGVIPIHKDEYTSYENLTGVSPYKIFTKGQTNIEGINITIL